MKEPSTTPNRRAAYRVELESPNEVDLTLLSQRQKLVRAVVEDVAIGGARIRLDKALAAERNLNAGTRVTIAVCAPRYQYNNEMPARVVKVTDNESDQTLHLSFDGDIPETPMYTSNNHYALFNRRTLQRGVVPGAGVDLKAQITPCEVTERSLRSYTVGVRNISNVGISLRLGANAHEVLSAYQELSLTLQLPGRKVVRRIACHVRHRLMEDGDFIYGCEYDWNATIDSLDVAEELLDFMLESSETP